MQTQMQRHDLAKEICVLLNDTVKGLRTWLWYECQYAMLHFVCRKFPSLA
jgi:hypothetical protein